MTWGRGENSCIGVTGCRRVGEKIVIPEIAKQLSGIHNETKLNDFPRSTSCEFPILNPQSGILN